MVRLLIQVVSAMGSDARMVDGSKEGEATRIVSIFLYMVLLLVFFFGYRTYKERVRLQALQKLNKEQYVYRGKEVDVDRQSFDSGSTRRRSSDIESLHSLDDRKDLLRSSQHVLDRISSHVSPTDDDIWDESLRSTIQMEERHPLMSRRCSEADAMAAARSRRGSLLSGVRGSKPPQNRMDARISGNGMTGTRPLQGSRRGSVFSDGGPLAPSRLSESGRRGSMLSESGLPLLHNGSRQNSLLSETTLSLTGSPHTSALMMPMIPSNRQEDLEDGREQYHSMHQSMYSEGTEYTNFTESVYDRY